MHVLDAATTGSEHPLSGVFGQLGSPLDGRQRLSVAFCWLFDVLRRGRCCSVYIASAASLHLLWAFVIGRRHGVGPVGVGCAILLVVVGLCHGARVSLAFGRCGGVRGRVPSWAGSARLRRSRPVPADGGEPVGDGGPNVARLEVGVLLEDVLRTCAVRHAAEQHFDRQLGVPEDRLCRGPTSYAPVIRSGSVRSSALTGLAQAGRRSPTASWASAGEAGTCSVRDDGVPILSVVRPGGA